MKTDMNYILLGVSAKGNGITSCLKKGFLISIDL